VDIKFHESSKKVVSVCQKIVRFWDMHTTQQFCSIEPAGMQEISDVAFKENGIFFIAGEHSKINVFYIPALGNAPSWCRFLDNLTEELEESKNASIYTDYKFVTREDLRSLGVEKIIGSPYLRAYMHGFFIDIRLYNKIKTIAQPNAFEEWRSELVRQKLELKRESRITVNKKNTPRVNKQQLSNNTPETDNLPDERFSKLFTDINYNRVDEPVGGSQQQQQPPQDLEDYSELSEEEGKTSPDKGEDSRDESIDESPQQEDDADKLVAFHQARNSKKSISSKNPPPPAAPPKTTSKTATYAPKRKIRFFESKDDHSGFPLGQRQQQENKKQRLQNAPFGKRVEIEKQLQSETSHRVSHNTITFTTEKKSSGKEKSQKSTSTTKTTNKTNKKSTPKRRRRFTK